MNKPLGLYVHIPFCATKCPYCDFYSVPYRSSLEQEYINAMVEHIYRYKGAGYSADTLYFGGGTPSLIKAQNIEKIVRACEDVFSLKGEITLEGNPNSVSKQKLLDLASVGINRLSFGMQSSVEKELSALGRTHTTNQVSSAIEHALSAGITNLSLDFMLGTPYQTLESVDTTLRFLTSLPIQHISAYMLKVEENTPYANSPLLPQCSDEDSLANIYLHTVSVLGQNEFHQYEISNFSKMGFESQHNLKYWLGDDYIGFGASAHSHLNKTRFFHPNDLNAYILSKGENIVYSDEHSDDIEEYIMLHLRLTKGLDLNELEELFGVKKQLLLDKSKVYIMNQLATINNSHLSLTPKGFLISNSIIFDLLQNVITV